MSIVTQYNDATNGLSKQTILYNNTAGRLKECTARRIGVGYCSTARYDGGKPRAQLSLRRASSAHRFSNEDDVRSIVGVTVNFEPLHCGWRRRRGRLDWTIDDLLSCPGRIQLAPTELTWRSAGFFSASKQVGGTTSVRRVDPTIHIPRHLLNTKHVGQRRPDDKACRYHWLPRTGQLQHQQLQQW